MARAPVSKTGNGRSSWSAFVVFCAKNWAFPPVAYWASYGLILSRTEQFASKCASKLRRTTTPFGTRGSQVQILPLRPAFSFHVKQF